VAERLRILPFDALGGREVHDLLALRSAVFVVEQACVYLDPDGADPGALHLLAHQLAEDGGRLVGALRILAPARIGRVVVAPEARGAGLARRMMTLALSHLAGAEVALSSQAHLAGFYASFGFVAVGPVHDEDGIPHVEMRLSARSG
jgi:ElaA protein